MDCIPGSMWRRSVVFVRHPKIWGLLVVLLSTGARAAVPCPDLRATASQWITPAVTGTGLTQRIFHSKSVGTEVSYHVYLPPAYEAEHGRRFPVLYWLHGTGGGIARVPMIAARFDAAMKRGDLPPMIVIFPHGLPSGMWLDAKDGSTPIESILIKDLIPHVDACLRSVASREGRLLEGFSMGGYGVARLAFRYPQMFAAVLMLAAGPLQPELWNTPRASDEERVRLMKTVYGNDMGFFREQSPWSQAAQAVRAGSKLPRLRQVVGTADETYPANLEFHRHLTSLGVEHEYVELPGVRHALPGIWSAMGNEIWSFYSKSIQP